MADRPFFYCGCNYREGAELAFAPTPPDRLREIAETHAEECGYGNPLWRRRSYRQVSREEAEKAAAAHKWEDPVCLLKLSRPFLTFPEWFSPSTARSPSPTCGLVGHKGSHLLTLRRVRTRDRLTDYRYQIRLRKNHHLTPILTDLIDPEAVYDYDGGVLAARFIVEGLLQGPCPRHGKPMRMEDMKEWTGDNDPWWRWGCDCLEREGAGR